MYDVPVMTARIGRRSLWDLLRVWKNRNTGGDRVQVSVTCFMPDESRSDWMEAKGFVRRGRASNRPVAFVLDSASLESNDADQRQILFENALETFRLGLAERGVDRAFVVSARASVKVYTTLSPVDGFADIFLFPEVLERWRDLNTSFHFDVIRRN